MIYTHPQTFFQHALFVDLVVRRAERRMHEAGEAQAGSVPTAWLRSALHEILEELLTVGSLMREAGIPPPHPDDVDQTQADPPGQPAAT